MEVTYSSSDEINAFGNSTELNADRKKSQNEMKQDSFLELINEGLEDNVWVRDLNNKNDGYPILKWQE